MTITVAMALSGLEPDQWNDGLKEIYMQGALLFSKSPSQLSLASSGASSYYSLESGISSMSPDSLTYHPYGGIQHPIDEFRISSRSDDGDELYGGSRTASISPIAIGGSALSAMFETNQRIISPISPPSSGSPHKQPAKVEEVFAPRMQPHKPRMQVMYEGRDALNLFANIRSGGWNCRPAQLPEGITSSYFENRSQYSRLQDAYPPKHARVTCRDKDCSFAETIYF